MMLGDVGKYHEVTGSVNRVPACRVYRKSAMDVDDCMDAQEMM